MIKLPSGVEIKNLIDDLRIVCWEVSETLTYYSQIVKDKNQKSNILKNDNLNDPVTLADLTVNEMIINRINEKYQGVNWEILSEENVKSSSRAFDLSRDWIWILDPLDGTKDFLQGTPNYAVHLALNYKQRPIIGVVLIPEKDELWIAVGNDIWCERRNEKILRPNLSNNKSLSEMVLVTSKNHRNETLKKLIKKINFKKVIVMGSIGCKISSILKGECDIYISLSLPGESSPKDWDFAAPEAILKAAGGAITNLDNQDLLYGISNYQKNGIIVASNNRETHENICLQLREIIKQHNIYPL